MRKTLEGNPLDQLAGQSIEEVLKLPAAVTWPGEYDREEFFTIHLQGLKDDGEGSVAYGGKPLDALAEFDGLIEYNMEKKSNYLTAGTLRVSEVLRGNGIGRRLTEAMAWIAVDKCCEGIRVDFAHPAALSIFRHTFGDDRISYLPKTVLGVEKPIDSPEDAEKAIVDERLRILDFGESWQINGALITRQPKEDSEILVGSVEGVGAWIDMSGFSAADLDAPAQLCELPEGYIDDLIDIKT